MKKQILNIGKALTKVEQRNVFGGLVDPNQGECKIYVRPAGTQPGDPDGYWTDCVFSYADATSFYSSGFFANNTNYLVTGYRCASEC